ncbi:MAG: major capsid protein, partial [Planctomycetaceae bacterium]|nr:major capsid protein [Planctomycetaceae bacterium]
KESSVTYVREDFDVQYEVYGMKWASATDNPTDAELATAANWDEDYQDHRQLKVVKGIFNATV